MVESTEVVIIRFAQVTDVSTIKSQTANTLQSEVKSSIHVTAYPLAASSGHLFTKCPIFPQRRQPLSFGWDKPLVSKSNEK